MIAVSVGLSVGYVAFACVPAEAEPTFDPSLAGSRPGNVYP